MIVTITHNKLKPDSAEGPKIEDIPGVYYIHELTNHYLVRVHPGRDRFIRKDEIISLGLRDNDKRTNTL